MAHVNTGKAFAKKLIVKTTLGGATTSDTYSVPDEIPNTSFGQLTLNDFALLSVEQAQARYAALRLYLNAQYAGLDLSRALTNEPIKEDVSLCPLPGTTCSVSVASGGNGAATLSIGEDVREDFVVNIGTQLSLAATPNTGYEFDGWYIGGVKQHTLGATATYQATADVVLEARFKIVVPGVVSVWLDVAPNEYGPGRNITVRSSYPVSCRMTVRLSARVNGMGFEPDWDITPFDCIEANTLAGSLQTTRMASNIEFLIADVSPRTCGNMEIKIQNPF